MKKLTITALLLSSLSFMAQAADDSKGMTNSTATEKSVSGGAAIGLPKPPYCMGNNFLQWTGSGWSCKKA